MTASAAQAARMRSVARRLAGWGVKVLEMPGWEGRGRGIMTPTAHVLHHTATTVDVDRTLRDGRSDLAGPLCNDAIHRDGTYVLVAAGTANHAGTGTVANSRAWGTEATGPPLARIRETYVLLCAAISLEMGWDETKHLGHKETARPEGRKPDPDFSARTVAETRYRLDDMPAFRAEVAAALRARSEEDDVDEVTLRTIVREENEAIYRLAARGVTHDGTVSAPHQAISLQSLAARLDIIEGHLLAEPPPASG